MLTKSKFENAIILVCVAATVCIGTLAYTAYASPDDDNCDCRDQIADLQAQILYINGQLLMYEVILNGDEDGLVGRLEQVETDLYDENTGLVNRMGWTESDVQRHMLLFQQQDFINQDVQNQITECCHTVND